MAEESVKTKDEINNNFSTSKEIDISYKAENNNMSNSENIDVNNQEIFSIYC